MVLIRNEWKLLMYRRMFLMKILLIGILLIINEGQLFKSKRIEAHKIRLVSEKKISIFQSYTCDFFSKYNKSCKKIADNESEYDTIRGNFGIFRFLNREKNYLIC